MGNSEAMEVPMQMMDKAKLAHEMQQRYPDLYRDVPLAYIQHIVLFTPGESSPL